MINLKHSWHDEEIIFKKLFENIKSPVRVCVDIGAGNLDAFSNSRTLLREGFSGLMIERQMELASRALQTAFEENLNLNFYCTIATPDNIKCLLKASDIPKNFGLLSIDIDSMDYHVLEAVLVDYHPQVICVEINERIPPGISYILPKDTNNLPRDSTMISSAGISNYEKLLHNFNYSLVALEYNNLIAISNDVASGKEYIICNISANDLWDKGFFRKMDWREKMPWNIPFEKAWTLPKVDCCNELKRLHKSLYNFECAIDPMVSDS